MIPNDRFYFLAKNQVVYDSASMIQLYQPIIGPSALMVYDYLVHAWDDGRADHRFTEVLNHLQLGPQVVWEALDVLGAMDLIALYQQDDTYLIKLFPALDRESFLANAIYRQLLASRIGDWALEQLTPVLPAGIKELTKQFSEVFTGRGEVYRQPKTSKNQFSLDYFKELMAKEGLQFADEASDVIGLYQLAEQLQLSWFDLFQAAKATAADNRIVLSRLTAKLQAGHQPAQVSSTLTDREQALIRAAQKQAAQDFLATLKHGRQAQVLESERVLIRELAQTWGFLDEVINVLVLYTLERTKSVNLNKAYLQKMANELAAKSVKTAAQALEVLRAGQPTKGTSSASQSGKAMVKSNVPSWSNQDYKNETSQEDQAKLEAYKKRRLEELGKGD